jgi:hypothetical protein
MRLPAALVLVAAASSLAVSPAAAQVSQKAPRASLVQVLRGGKQALILDRVRGEYEVVRVGDSIHGLRVAEIEPDQIVLATPSPPERYFVLPLVEAAPAPGAPKAGAVDPRTGEAGPDPGVRDDAPPAAGAPAAPGPASPDSALPDSALPDSALPDSASPDRSPDRGSPDRGSPDRGSPDAPPPGDRTGPADAPPDEGDVLDPYGSPGDVGGDGSQAPVDSYADPYGPVGSGLPSVIAPPDSRADPGPSAPDPARRPDQRAPAPPDRAPTPDPELDADSPDRLPEDDLGDDGLDDDFDDPDAEPIAPEPPANDSNVTKVKPTEVQPGAAPPRPRAKDDQVKDLSRRELDWALSDFAALSKQIRIERASGGGVRIVDLERGSFVDKLGLKRGDVVKRVAGHSIDTVDEAAAAYAALESARDVVVELERRGAPLRLRYRLTK